MIFPRRCRNSCVNVSISVAAVGCIALAITAQAASFSQARVTRIQNKVNYGVVKAGRTITRPAVVADLVRENNYLLTETESRAELQYEDGSVVRIGQNTVFSFDADNRQLTLEKGSLIFYIPKGSGGGLIKTPSLTAAITGTVGKVSVSTIAILEGQAKLVPSGRIIDAGSFARRNADGSTTISPMAGNGGDGQLMRFNGPMPGYTPPEPEGSGLTLDLSQLNLIRTMDIGTNLPGSIRHFFPPDLDRNKRDAKVPQRTERPTGPGDGGTYGGTGGTKGT